MYCNKCGNKLMKKAAFCENCGAIIEQNSGRKSNGVSKLGLTGIITASIVIVSCILSWFFFFAGPPVDAGTDKTRKQRTELTTTKAFSVTDTNENPNKSTTESSSSTKNTLETPEQTTAESAETTATNPIEQATYDATEKPVFEDFVWYTDNIHINGRPDQAIQLDFSELQGSWKALLWYDPQNMMDAEGWDSLLIDISGNPDNVMLKLDWQDSYIKSIDSLVDVSALADTEMMGVYDIEGIKAGEPGYELYLTDFYLLADYQYGFGYMLVASGEEVFVALVRP